MTATIINGHAWLKSPDVVWSEGKKPIPISNVHNAIVALKTEPGLRDMLAFDEFAFSPTLVHPINQPMCPDFTPRPMVDKDVIDIMDYLQSIELKHVTKPTVFAAIHTRSREFSFHPVKEYFATLPQWDEGKRLDTWLCQYAGCEDTPHVRMAGRKFLIGMVRRVFNPGCKMDYMIVLEGPQGIGKSTFLRELVNIHGDNRWFTDHLPPIGSKDTQQAMSGVWLIEVAELHAFGKVEANHLKSFLTQRDERFRAPYGLLTERVPRQNVFAGTTNKDAYLKDETGGRRFWPCRITHPMDIYGADDGLGTGGLIANRDQLFAEAVYYVLNDDEDCYPPAGFEAQYMKPEQDKRYDEDVWQEKVAVYLQSLKATTISDVLFCGLGLATDRHDRRNQLRVSSILQNLGWGLGKRGTGGVRRWIAPGVIE